MTLSFPFYKFSIYVPTYSERPSCGSHACSFMMMPSPAGTGCGFVRRSWQNRRFFFLVGGRALRSVQFEPTASWAHPLLAGGLLAGARLVSHVRTLARFKPRPTTYRLPRASTPKQISALPSLPLSLSSPIPFLLSSPLIPFILFFFVFFPFLPIPLAGEGITRREATTGGEAVAHSVRSASISAGPRTFPRR